MESQGLTDGVIRELARRDILGVNHIGATKSERCAKDGTPFERFVGIKDGWQYMAHICPSCGKASVWNLDIAEPAEHFEIDLEGGPNAIRTPSD